MSVDFTKLKNRLIQTIRDEDYEPQSYSGRGMYGEECVAFVADSQVSTHGALIDVCSNIVQQIEDDTLSPEEAIHMMSYMQDVRTDSLGRGTIVYFRNVPWDPDFEASENEEEE